MSALLIIPPHLLVGLQLWPLITGGAAAETTPRVLSEVDSTDATADLVPDFVREVKPILADTCFACHGPDEVMREARLRLDVRDGLFGERRHGTPVTPGSLDDSLLWQRINSATDPMPPEGEGRPLVQEEREILRRWIEGGAPFTEHWAFRSIEEPAPPPAEEGDWGRNEVDRFVLRGLQAAGLEPAPEADAVARLRRVTLDLTGLPPTADELDAFLADPSDEAYEAAVERLLNSEAYAERQAGAWLDVARYADSNGDGSDGAREMWRWRDWVINAFKDGMPYDQFVTEQVAGDLIPDATTSQKVATGFLRNHPIFTKGGAVKDEYRHAYVVDRVNTVGTAFLGLTLGCVQCHDHKYDPISQSEYYGLYAFFNNASERDVGRSRGNTRPVLHLPQGDDEPRLEELEESLAELHSSLEGQNSEWDEAFEAWAAAQLERARWAPEWEVLEPVSMMSLGGARLATQEDGSIVAEGWNPGSDTYHLVLRPGKLDITALRLEVLPHEGNARGGSGRSERGTFALGELEVYVCTEASGDEGDRVKFLRGEDDAQHERQRSADKAVDGSTRSGWSLFAEETVEEHQAVFLPKETIELNDNSILRIVFEHSGSRRVRETIGRFRLSMTTDAELRRRMLPVEPGDWYALGPFPGEDAAKAFATEFEPEASIPGGVDLDEEYTAPKAPKRKRGGSGKPGEGGKPSGGPAGDGEEPEGEGARTSDGERAASSEPERSAAGKAGGKPGNAEGKSDQAKGKSEQAKGKSDQAKGKSGQAKGKAGKTKGKAGGKPENRAPGGADRAEAGGTNEPRPMAPPEPEFDPAGGDPEEFNPAEFFGGGGERRRRDGKLRWTKKEDWRDGSSFRLDGSGAVWYLERDLEVTEDRRVRVWFDGGQGLAVWLDGEKVHERPVPEPKEEEEKGRSEQGGFSFFSSSSDPDFDPDPADPDGRSRYPVWYDDGVVLELSEGEHELVLKVAIRSRESFNVRIDPLGEDVMSLAVARALREHGEARSGRSPEAGEDKARPVVFQPRAPDEVAPEWTKVELPDPREARSRELRQWFRSHALPETDELILKRARERDERLKLLARSPTVMVMNDDRPRTTRLLVRGAWDQPGEVIEPHTPSVLAPMVVEGKPDRLDLARWLTDPENPLPARVAVNRFWAQHFTRGLVATAGDFGVRGELPTHPELLDWLSKRFVDSGWDIRALHKLIVTSSTYQQASEARDEVSEVDPDGRLLARMPRVRLAAEEVRDHALAASGLLNTKLGGESIKPYQPEGLWESIGKGGGSYRPSEGDDLYRRGLYVFWKRGVLYPSFALFDAPTRSTCTVERIETNTPLQALVLLNDPVYVEAGRALGLRMLDEGGASDGARLAYGFRLATSRMPDTTELTVMLRVLARQRAHWTEKPEEAGQYLEVGELESPDELEATEAAAWAAVGQLLLNLDSSLHRS